MGVIPDGRGPLVDVEESHPILESELLHHGLIFDMRRDTVDYADVPIVREYIDHPGAVAIVAVDDQGRIAVVDQYRHPVRKRMWEIPAGLRDVPGEDPLAAAKRELAEETDLQASEWSPLLLLDNSPGGSAEELHVYLARGLSPAHSDYVREAEEADMTVSWATPEEVVDGILAGRLSNPSLVAGVLGYLAWLRGQR